MTTPAIRAQQKRREAKRLFREAEILRYWIRSSIACLVPGAFTSDASEGAVAARGVIAASASIRPSLRHITQRIRDADDRGANRLFGPVMTMIESVLKKLFLTSTNETSGSEDALRSACIKFLEIVVLCCSSKPKDSSARRRGHGQGVRITITNLFMQLDQPNISLPLLQSEDFSLDDLPAGHPIITRESLEAIAEYAFTTLRGLTFMGGQVKIDVNVLSDMMLASGGDGSPAAQVVSILKPAALAFLEIESSVRSDEDEPSLEFLVDRSGIDFDFVLGQKSYTFAVNAVAALALNRPVFFKEAAVCLARRAADPPISVDDGPLSKSAVIAITSQLRASCLTLLRNALAISTSASSILHSALKLFDMELQADKALSMARQSTALKTAGRAARNRANMYYEWDESELDNKRVTKRQRETDDALAKMRAAKAARGLGHGIQLPTNMVDAIELILANLSHLPSSRPPVAVSTKTKKVDVSLDFVIDAVMTNGASLAQNEGRWYDRDGGSAWHLDLDSDHHFRLDPTLLKAAELDPAKSAGDDGKGFQEQRSSFVNQCQAAAADSFGRMVVSSSNASSPGLHEFSARIAARLSWTLRRVQPPQPLQDAHSMALGSTSRVPTKDQAVLADFVNSYPLVSSCLALEMTAKASNETDKMATQGLAGKSNEKKTSLSNRVLYEGYLESSSGNKSTTDAAQYQHGLDVFVASAVYASKRADEKPGDNERKKAAALAAVSLQRDLALLPVLTPSSLQIVSAMCDIDDITKKAADASRKTSQQTIAASAAIHAAKAAAEKRATAALLILRDAAFQRSERSTRKSAVDCAVGLAAGRLPSSASIEDKALKLVMNVLYPKTDTLADLVVESATAELIEAANFAIEKFDTIQSANKAAAAKNNQQPKNSLAPVSDDEKKAMDQVRKPAVLFMALCVRRPEIIKTLMTQCCRDNADVLAKAVRANMPKLARAAATKHGTAAIAIKVAEMASADETPMVLAFLDNLAPATDRNVAGDDLIEACHKIQDSKKGADGKKDPRFIIPVVAVMRREQLVEKLPEFVQAEDNIFMAALVRMGDRLTRQALLFRDEPDPEHPALRGMTLCEQFVYLHKLDFAAAGILQKRYLDVIKLCLDDDEVFTDRVVMAGLDHMSGKFLSEEEILPRAFMRTAILVCSKHESLHSWICHVLLPRLIEAKIYNDLRQWEGWQRLAKLLENLGDSGVSSAEAIRKLPPEQLALYRERFGRG